MEIRRASTADASAIARVHVDSWRAAYKGLVPDEYLDHLDYEKRAVWFREHLGESSPEIFVIVESEEVLGFLTVGPSRDGDLATSKVGEIHGIYLSPGRWRQGIGRRVCRYAEDLLLSRGYSGASLWVFAGNESAKRFYESVGFAADGASKVLDVGVALDAIRYRKDIRRAEQAPASGSPRFGAQPGSG